MKLLRLLIAVSLITLLAACSKHPSSLVGVWKSGESGAFSAQVVLVLGADGTGAMHTGLGIFGGTKEGFQWEFAKSQLKTRGADGKVSVTNVISSSSTTLVIQDPGGTMMTFSRISDNVDPAALQALATAATQKNQTAAAAPPPPAPQLNLSVETKIQNNLKLLSAIADTYYLENATNTVVYADLVGPTKRIKALESLSGEDYSKLIFVQGKGLEVTTPDGKVYHYGEAVADPVAEAAAAAARAAQEAEILKQRAELARVAAEKKAELDARKAAYLKKHLDAVVAGKRYEGQVLYRNDKFDRISFLVTQSDATGFTAQIAGMGNDQSSAIWSGVVRPPQNKTDGMIALRAEGAGTGKSWTFKSRDTKLQLELDASGSLVGAGSNAGGSFTITLSPAAVANSTSVSADPAGTTTTTPPLPPAAPKADLATLMGAHPVLHGQSGSGAQDQFTLTNVRVVGDTLTAEYHEPNDKAVYEVAGRITATTWNFAGTKWITKPAGAMGALKNFTAQLTLSDDGIWLKGPYKITGSKGSITINVTGGKF